jgi:hypothetical protein
MRQKIAVVAAMIHGIVLSLYGNCRVAAIKFEPCMVYGLTWYDIALYMTFLVLNI